MEIQPLDIAVVVVILVALMRGFFVGIVREGFILAGLGAAYLAVQLYTLPTADWLEHISGGDIGPGISPWIAGAGLAIGTVTIIVMVGRGLQRTMKTAGLSWADKAGGALLGTVEGLLIAGILLVMGAEILGRDHPAFSETASLAALEELERISEESEIDIDVAAPPRTF